MRSDWATYVNDTRVRAGRANPFSYVPKIAGPKTARKTLWNAVVQLNRLFNGVEKADVDDGRKDLLFPDGVGGVRGLGNGKCRLHKVSSTERILEETATASEDFGPGRLQVLDGVLVNVQGLRVVNRTKERRVDQRVTRLHRGVEFLHLLDELRRHVPVKVQSPCRSTSLPGRTDATEENGRHSQRQISVGHDNGS